MYNNNNSLDMDGNYSSNMERILYMLEEGDYEITDLLKLKYEVDYHVAAYFESLNLPNLGPVLKGETAKQLNSGAKGKERLKARKDRFGELPIINKKEKLDDVEKNEAHGKEDKKSKKWHGTVYISNLPCEGKNSDGLYVHDLLTRYGEISGIKYLRYKEKKRRGEWTGDVIVLLKDLEVKKKLIEEGLYLPEHKEYSNVMIEHHQKIEWRENN